MPWLWLPNGCDPARIIRPEEDPQEGPVQFGYFGTLAQHGGLPALLRIFTQERLDATLHICGYGKTKDEIAQRCADDPHLRFHAPRTPDECVRFATTCDVMVNPRPIVPGNENNFSSKVFEYALSGRAILTSRVSGVDVILGPEAFYFEAEDFERSLGEVLRQVAATPRAELRCRGAAIQERVRTEFSWDQQGKRCAEFLRGVLAEAGR
jgi:glycosyltransferase involved in cell wall biosynthesis